MLKITFSETPTEEKWVLYGQLTAPWVRELRTTWKKNHRRGKDRACVVDLNDVTFIDKKGEQVLRSLKRQGAEFIARGIYTSHIVERLNARGTRSKFKLLAGLLVAIFVVLTNAAVSKAQNTEVTGSVPNGPASDQVLQLTLRDAINMALRYNLGAIESGDNARIARGQRLVALSNLKRDPRGDRCRVSF